MMLLLRELEMDVVQKNRVSVHLQTMSWNFRGVPGWSDMLAMFDVYLLVSTTVCLSELIWRNAHKVLLAMALNKNEYMGGRC